MKPVCFHPEAENEYATAAHYYAHLAPELGGRFYDEIERLLQDVRTQPDLFRLWSPPVRRHFSDVFPYAVLYVDQADCIRIVAIMHMNRRPDYWKSRLS